MNKWTVFEPGDQGLFAINRNNPIASALFDRLLMSTKIASDIRYFVDLDSTKAGFDTGISNLPTGVCIATFQIADPLPTIDWVDETWHRHLRWATPKLVLAGGLRFGQKDHWIAGAGPIVRIHGQNLPSKIEIDGTEYPVASREFRHPVLSKPARHIVRARVDGTSLDVVVQVSPVEHEDNGKPTETGWQLLTERSEWPYWLSLDEEVLTANSLLGLRLLLSEKRSPSISDNRAVILSILFNHSPNPASIQSDHPIARMLHRKHLSNVTLLSSAPGTSFLQN